MKKYKLIVFDFDGTLVDTIHDIAYYVNVVLSHYGFPGHGTEKIKRAVGWGVHDLFKSLEPEFEKTPERLEEAVSLFKAKYQNEPVLQTTVFKGVREALSGSLANVKKAIVTNKPQDITLKILDRLDLDYFFEPVVGINSGFLPKPDPAGTLHVMESLCVLPDEVLFIGDSGIDAETSVNAGVDFGYVNYGYHELGRLPAIFRFSCAAEWSCLAI